jgi:hypothetical protein
MWGELRALADHESLGKTRLVGSRLLPVADVANPYLPRSAGQLSDRPCVAREMVVVLLCGPRVDEGTLVRSHGSYRLPVVQEMMLGVLEVVRHRLRHPGRPQKAPIMLGTYH